MAVTSGRTRPVRWASCSSPASASFRCVRAAASRRCTAAANDPAQGDLYADDAIHEVPWAPTGKPMTMTAPMVRAAISAAGDPPLHDQTLDVRSLISEGDVACAEYAMTGTLRRSGEPFQLSGVMVIRVRAGQIVHSRSYMDPQALASLAG